MLHELVLEIGELESRVKTVEKHLKAVAAQTPVAKRLRTIPGVGLLTARRLSVVSAMWRAFLPAVTSLPI